MSKSSDLRKLYKLEQDYKNIIKEENELKERKAKLRDEIIELAPHGFSGYIFMGGVDDSIQLIDYDSLLAFYGIPDSEKKKFKKQRKPAYYIREFDDDVRNLFERKIYETHEQCSRDIQLNKRSRNKK
jgi:hypothetical protein